MKTVDICSCLPTNLHINDIWIQRRSYQDFYSLEDLFSKCACYIMIYRGFVASTKASIFEYVMWNSQCVLLWF